MTSWSAQKTGGKEREKSDSRILGYVHVPDHLLVTIDSCPPKHRLSVGLEMGALAIGALCVPARITLSPQSVNLCLVQRRFQEEHFQAQDTEECKV